MTKALCAGQDWRGRGGLTWPLLCGRVSRPGGRPVVTGYALCAARCPHNALSTPGPPSAVCKGIPPPSPVGGRGPGTVL